MAAAVGRQVACQLPWGARYGQMMMPPEPSYPAVYPPYVANMPLAAAQPSAPFFWLTSREKGGENAEDPCRSQGTLKRP